MILVEPAVIAVSWCFSAVLIGVIVTVLWWLDRYDREPIGMVAAAFVWGAVFVPLIIVGVRTLAPPFLAHGSSLAECRWLGFFLAPAAVEIAKGLGLLLVLSLTRTFDSPTDGFVYGAAVGAGFSASGLFFIGVGAGAGPGGALIEAGVVSSSLWFTGLHVLVSSVMGACVGAGRLVSSWVWRSVWLSIALIGAVVLDAVLTWLALESGGGPLAGRPWALIIPLYAVLLGVLSAILFAEGRVIKRQIADEIRLGVLPGWTVEVIPHYRRRVQSDWWPLRRERTVISRLLTQLAFRKQSLVRARTADSNLEGLEIVRLRERIQKIVCPPKSPISPLTEEMW